uniref:Uncharacterized protein n=1 Tax=Tetranychus urticae TaxID=32264 RepID=T1K1V0_TETUR
MDDLKCTPSPLSSPPALRKRIRLLIHLLITTLSAGQIYSIAIDYLYGEITNKVNLMYPEKFILPDVSLCFPFLDLINLTKADQQYGNFSSILKNRPFFEDYSSHNDVYTEIYSLLGNLTTKQLNGLLKDIKHAAPLVELAPNRRPDNLQIGPKLINADSYCEIFHFIRQPSFCLTIKCLNETKQPLEYKREHIFQQPYNGVMLKIQLNPNVSIMASTVNVIFTSHSHLTQGKKQSAFRIGFRESPATHIITYSKIINVLVQEDYEMSCFNYSLIGYLSRDDYLDACLNNASSQATGAVFYGTVQNFNDTSDHMSDFHQFYHEYLNPNETEREKRRQFYKFCREYCAKQADKPDCHQEILYPVGFRKIIRSDGVYEVVVRAPASPFEINRYFPEYTLLDLLIYFASSLNFWFGLSLVSLSERFLNFYCNLFKRKKESKSQKSNSTIKLHKAKVTSSKPVEVFVVQTRRPRVTKIKDISNELPTVYY